MNRFLCFALVLLLLFSSSSFGDETAEKWGENNAGMNVLTAAETPNVVQQIGPFTTAQNTFFRINFQGDWEGGIGFTCTIKNESAVADTLVRYWYAPTSSSNSTRARADSVKFTIQPNKEEIFRLLCAEGDSLRWIKGGAGRGELFLGGAKNLGGRFLSEY